MDANTAPKISFGVIVLNGEPFTRYCLRSLYEFAHEIFVVEGACKGAHEVATADGHSRDGTLEVLQRFQRQEDPDGRLTIITAEDAGHPDGFWPGEKDEQSQAYARRATGDYLWQVDVDEFYRAYDMRAIMRCLSQNPGITAVSFHQITFWGGLDYLTDGWYLRRGAACYHRLFKWEQGYRYVTHRPPTVIDEQGRDLRALNWLSGAETRAKGIRLYHYSLLFPKQVREKCSYYKNTARFRRGQALEWAEQSFIKLQRPYRPHNVYQYPSWLERFEGIHPCGVQRMWQDVESGRLNIEVRGSSDIEALLQSPVYRIGRTILKYLEPIDRCLSAGRHFKQRGLRAARKVWSAVRRIVN